MLGRPRAFVRDPNNEPSPLIGACADQGAWLLSLSLVFNGSRENRPRARINSTPSRAVGTRAVANSAIAAGIDVSRGQHAQKRGATAGTSRTGTPANPGDCSCPLKPIMQRCVFLGLKIVHRTKPPRGETRPRKLGRRFTLPWARRKPRSPGASPSWLKTRNSIEALTPTSRRRDPYPHGEDLSPGRDKTPKSAIEYSIGRRWH